MCTSSNVQTGAVRDLASHPLKLYHSLGLRVTVNTDNRLVTDTTVSHELWHCHTHMGFSLEDIKAVVVAGFKSAFLPFHVKPAYLRRVTQDLTRFHADGTIAPEAPEASAHHAQTGFRFGVGGAHGAERGEAHPSRAAGSEAPHAGDAAN